MYLKRVCPRLLCTATTTTTRRQRLEIAAKRLLWHSTANPFAISLCLLIHHIIGDRELTTRIYIMTPLNTDSVGLISKESNGTRATVGGNTDLSSLEKNQEQKNLVLLGMVAIIVVVLTCQIVSSKNLSKESGFYSVIACSGSVSVTLSVLVLIDVVRQLHADFSASVKFSLFVLLFCFYATFLIYVTASTSHHIFVVFMIYVLVALSTILHFTMAKIVKTKNSRVIINHDVSVNK